jgi:hypothetical protein
MKNLLSVFLITALIISLTACVDNSSSAFDFEYIIIDDGISITRYTGSATEVIIPGTIEGKPVTRIESLGFSRAGASPYTERIIISNSVNYIGENAFYGGQLLNSINVNNENPYFSDINGVLFNKEQTILIRYPNNKETDYVIPNGVTDIGNAAFSGISKLETIVIPYGVTTIGDSAFAACTGLTDITIPNSVINVGDRAFSDCRRLSAVTLSDNLNRISDFMFQGCEMLSEITIPNGVASIGEGAFDRCTTLTKIIIPDSVKSVEQTILHNYNVGKRGSFYGCKDLEIIYKGHTYKSVQIGYATRNGLVAEHYYDLPEEFFNAVNGR